MQHSTALEFKKSEINFRATKRIGTYLYCVILRISTLHGIMILPLNLDQGKCVLPVGPWCGLVGGRGNTLFWKGLVLVYRDSVGFSSRLVKM